MTKLATLAEVFEVSAAFLMEEGDTPEGIQNLAKMKALSGILTASAGQSGKCARIIYKIPKK